MIFLSRTTFTAMLLLSVTYTLFCCALQQKQRSLPNQRFPKKPTTTRTAESLLSAWPTPQGASSFESGGFVNTAWYCEYDNPLGHRASYDE